MTGFKGKKVNLDLSEMSLILGSRIRGAVAHVPFDEFHRHSSQVIQHAVFDRQPDGSLAQNLNFSANNLVSNIFTKYVFQEFYSDKPSVRNYHDIGVIFVFS